MDPSPTLPGLLVDASWLADHLDRLVPCDVRWYLDGRSGRAAYEAGHLPGAVHVDVDAHLAAPPSAQAGRHPLPDASAFAAALGALGIGDADPVVAYDDAGGAIAARLVWMLRVLGHPAALLDGGLAAWPGPLEAGATARPPAAFSPRPWPPDRLATIDDVGRAAGGDGGPLLVDARAGERYRGEVEPVDPRAGHIPSAHSLPSAGNLDPTSGRFLPPALLRQRFLGIGADGSAEVISYCGSGVTACHNLLALERAGLPPGRLYPGSWSQWSADPARPAATGPEP